MGNTFRKKQEKNESQISEIEHSQILQKNYMKIINKINGVATNQDYNKGVQGLHNLGNTCFMNTIIQCLSNVQPLTDYFISNLHVQDLNKSNKKGSRGEIALAFGNIIKQFQNFRHMWVGEQQQDIDFNNVMKNLQIKFFQSLKKYGTQFIQGTQEDAHEFLMFLLDMIHEDLNRINKKQKILDKDYYLQYNDINPLNQEILFQFENFAMESWENYLKQNSSVIVDLFVGQFLNTIHCLECNNISQKYQIFNNLQIPIKDLNIQMNIINFTLKETLQEDEQWFCPKCKKKTRSTKQIQIWKCPNILIIQLKRFEIMNYKLQKKNDFVKYPLKELDLTEIVLGPQKCKPIYNLIAVCLHQGDLYQGHYTAISQNRYSQQWFYYNDIHFQEIFDDIDVVTNKAYTLFYQNTTMEHFNRQSLSSKQNWPHLNTI